MNYATIKWTDIANGEGVRISLFVSGCTRHCKDCFNAVAWDFNYGQPFDEEVQNKIFEGLKADYIAGLSLLGGEPFEPENQRALLPFVREAKKRFPDKTIWCYTGNVYDPATGLLKETDKNTEVTEELLSYIDVLVDGEFVADLKNIRLKFRGSSNQRVLDMKKTKKSKTPVFYLD
ncbi:MAG: anaerobic ribonucleoside-triphosphate reductase activating protein [Clostridiales bacterium]|nr:anaerobic ribonucleoside-triphosphate reductase activating protein [Clostridiales bacterium]MDY4895118.1 anaerobic ribonucleoside-triphosphate reductase activating protein [Christensenellaceae bacterium]